MTSLLLVRRVALAGLVLACASCAKRTEIVIGVATDLRRPDDIDEVELFVRDDFGSLLASGAWDVDPRVGLDILPGSIGLTPRNDPREEILVVVQGSKVIGLNPDGTNKIEPRISRRARLSFVEGRTLFLRMVLLDPCFGVDKARESFCNDVNKWCYDGTCQGINIDGNGLPDYHPGDEKKAQCGDDWMKLGLAPPDKVACPDGQICVDAECRVVGTVMITNPDMTPPPASDGATPDDLLSGDGAMQAQQDLTSAGAVDLAMMSMPDSSTGPADLTSSSWPDMATPADLRPPPQDQSSSRPDSAMGDATAPSDLTVPPSDFPPPDFSLPDSSVPFDATPPPAPDMFMPPPDLTDDMMFFFPDMDLPDLSPDDSFIRGMGELGMARPSPGR